MSELEKTAPAFVEMAHRIVWCSFATVGSDRRPRSRVMHPYWEWDGYSLVGSIATRPTRAKLAHIEHNPYVSLSYWSPEHDTCVAECRASWLGEAERLVVWEMLKNAPPPIGYDPAIVPAWSDGPQSPAFAALRLEPWRLRVFPGSVMLSGGGEVLIWQDDLVPYGAGTS